MILCMKFDPLQMERKKATKKDIKFLITCPADTFFEQTTWILSPQSENQNLFWWKESNPAENGSAVFELKILFSWKDMNLLDIKFTVQGYL